MRTDHKKKHVVGLVDADLLDGGTRHPNLVLLKLAGFLRDNEIEVKLITDSDCDVSIYDYIYISRVFTFTQLPEFYKKANGRLKKKIRVGGTGEYANEENVKTYRKLREEDMTALERDPFLNTLRNKCGGMKKHGIDMARQMPYYDLYRPFIISQVKKKKAKRKRGFHL